MERKRRRTADLNARDRRADGATVDPGDRGADRRAAQHAGRARRRDAGAAQSTINPASIKVGAALSYLGMMIRDQSYADHRLFGQRSGGARWLRRARPAAGGRRLQAAPACRHLGVPAVPPQRLGADDLRPAVSRRGSPEEVPGRQPRVRHRQARSRARSARRTGSSTPPKTAITTPAMSSVRDTRSGSMATRPHRAASARCSRTRIDSPSSST